MKKTIFSIGILVALLLCGMLIKWGFVKLFYAEPTVIQTHVSPNGKYTAYVYESNGGATTGWVYHISILQTGKKLDKDNGNIYISEIPPVNVVWLDNSTLYVVDYDSVRTTKRKEKIYGIDVRFKSLERKRFEASAITISNAISEELGLGIHNSFYTNGYYMAGQWYQYEKPEIYGAFPYEYTNGMATMFRSYGPDKANYYRMR